MAPEKIASTAAGPALKVLVWSVTSGPSFSARMPFSIPTSPAAWVMFGK
jgi:hypothetical protein